MIIYTMFGYVKPVKSFKELIKNNGFEFMDCEGYSYITVEGMSEETGCVYVDGSDFIGMPQRTLELREIVTHDNNDMDDNHKAFEKEFLQYIKREAIDLTGSVRATINSIFADKINITPQTHILCGIEEAWGSYIDHIIYHNNIMFLLYLGDDKFTLVPDVLKMGIKTKAPYGFFLYAPLDTVPLFKLEGIGEFLKQEGVIDE